MKNSCQIFTTEYQHQFTKKKQFPVEKSLQSDCFAERVEDWQIDSRLASVTTKIDEKSEKLIKKHIRDNARSIYEVSYKNPWDLSVDKEKDFGSELLAYIHKLYFDPHQEKVLAPPVTTKRVFGYSRPKLLHGGLSIYQDTYGRTGGAIVLQNVKPVTTIKENTRKEDNLGNSDSCQL